MWRRTAFIALWVVATFVATSVAVAAVRGVTDRVVDAPTPPLSSATGDGTLDASSTSLQIFRATTRAPGDSATGGPEGADGGTSGADGSSGNAGTDGSGGTVTTDPGDTSTTEPPTSTTTPTSTTQGGSTTTTTTEPPTTTTQSPPQTTTYQLVGGWVRVESFPGTVVLLGAGPNPGFDMDIDDTGPDEVEVEFESDDHESKIKIKWSGGVLDVDVQEIPKDDQDEQGSADEGDDDLLDVGEVVPDVGDISPGVIGG